VDRVWTRRRIPIRRALLAGDPSSDPDNRTETPPILGRSANPIDPPSALPFHTRSRSRSPLRKCDAKTDCHRIEMGHEAAAILAIPGSGTASRR